MKRWSASSNPNLFQEQVSVRAATTGPPADPRHAQGARILQVSFVYIAWRHGRNARLESGTDQRSKSRTFQSCLGAAFSARKHGPSTSSSDGANQSRSSTSSPTPHVFAARRGSDRHAAGEGVVRRSCGAADGWASLRWEEDLRHTHFL